MANLTDADKVLRNDTGKDIASKLDAIKTAIQNQSTTLNNLSDVSILSVQDGQFLKYDSTEQRWINVSLPDPMVFKGTLGTGGTITTLPVDGSANVGDTYKVIEDGTYSGTSAKVGDLFSCLTKTSSANTWVLIPSGDESFTDTWRGIKVNGTEKLTSSISSGEVDFVEGSNIQITFDTTGNKIVISATDTTYSEATQSTSGLMSASDKTKLDTIPNTIPTTADTQPITNGSAVNTKEYIDDKTTLVKSASGSLVHITDGGDNIPVKSLESEIVAVESGSGEKSPTNPYTISGFDSGVITRCGKNLFNPLTQFNEIGSYAVAKNVLPNTKCIMSFVDKGTSVDVSNISFGFCDSNYSGGALETDHFRWVFLDGVISSKTNVTQLMTLTGLLVYPRTQETINKLLQRFDIQIEIGDTATTHKAYNGNNYEFAFGQTIYGGHFDNKGNLVVTHGYIASYNGETLNEPWISSMDNYVPNTSPSTGAQVVYPLTTPITLSITSQDIPTLLGENNIFSNCGDLEVTYYTSKSNDILEFIDTEIGKKTWTSLGTITDGGTGINVSAYSEVLVIVLINNSVKYDSYVFPVSAIDTDGINITVNQRDDYWCVGSLKVNNDILTYNQSLLSTNWTSSGVIVYGR